MLAVKIAEQSAASSGWPEWLSGEQRNYFFESYLLSGHCLL